MKNAFYRLFHQMLEREIQIVMYLPALRTIMIR